MDHDELALTAGAATLLDDFALTIRVKKIFARYCAEGKRPTREEAESWLKSEGWRDPSHLLQQWGYQ